MWKGPTWFYLAALLLLLGNLFLMNDLTTVWSGAETEFIWSGIYADSDFALHRLLATLGEPDGWSAFGLRLPGGLLFLLALALFYVLAAPFFGKPLSAWAVVVTASTLLIPNLSKFALADHWLFPIQLALTLLVIRYLKQPRWSWLLLVYLLGGLGFYLHSWSTVLVLSGQVGLLMALHPRGRGLWRLLPLLLVGWGIVFWWSPPAGYFFGAHLGQNLFYHFLGVAPFWGFVLAGLWETIRKVRRGEELAAIMVAWLVGGLLGQSALLQAVLGLLAARQMIAFFNENYPHRPIVRTGAILHLILAFFVAMGLMMLGFAEFGGAGFRAGLGFSVPYWALSFIAVIGLFGLRARMLLWSPVFAGLLGTLTFWTQLNPFLEDRRDVPREILQRAESLRTSETEEVFWSDNNHAQHRNIELYLRTRFEQVTRIDSGRAANFRNDQRPQLLILQQKDSSAINGIDDCFKRVHYSVDRE